MKNVLLKQVKNHWKQLRGMTYDFLKLIKEEDLERRLPFPESQSLGYQFYCMIGAQESNISLITKGVWKGFTCSLDNENRVIKKTIVLHMKEADRQLYEALEKANLLKKFDGGITPLLNYMVLVEHESHHQGQIINFIYAHNLPIPDSWKEKWALTRD